LECSSHRSTEQLSSPTISSVQSIELTNIDWEDEMKFLTSLLVLWVFVVKFGTAEDEAIDMRFS
jgi:hypothetical protein